MPRARVVSRTYNNGVKVLVICFDLEKETIYERTIYAPKLPKDQIQKFCEKMINNQKAKLVYIKDISDCTFFAKQDEVFFLQNAEIEECDPDFSLDNNQIN
ncbi:MAG: hypothetical protein IJV00_08405 [Clostridia bacterium]|nr:hypothetical protein [Clostridia bacterium]